jgi:hypothetical protein
MSSVLTSFAQIEPTLKYLITLAPGNTNVYRVNAGSVVTATMSGSTFTAATTLDTGYLAVGTELRDLGKFVMTYNTQKQHTALYRLVQPQLGYETEGVPGNYATERFYVAVWAADNSTLPVTVARMG